MQRFDGNYWSPRKQLFGHYWARALNLSGRLINFVDMSILDWIWGGTLSLGIDDSITAWPLRLVMDTRHPTTVGTWYPSHRYLYSSCWAPTTTLAFITWFVVLLLDIRNLWLVSWFHDGSVDKSMWLENHWNDWLPRSDKKKWYTLSNKSRVL